MPYPPQLSILIMLNCTNCEYELINQFYMLGKLTMIYSNAALDKPRVELD